VSRKECCVQIQIRPRAHRRKEGGADARQTQWEVPLLVQRPRVKKGRGRYCYRRVEKPADETFLMAAGPFGKGPALDIAKSIGQQKSVPESPRDAIC